MAAKPFEIHITLDAPELAQAITDLSLAIRDRVPVIQPTQDGAEVVIPAGTPMTVAGVQTAPQAPALAPVQSPVQQIAPAAPVQPPVQQITPAPVQQIAPAAPVQPTPVTPPAPTVSPVQPVVTPQTAPAPEQSAGVTMEAIINAGAALVEKGMMAQVVAILQKYGIQAVNQLQPQQFEPFAAELRALGAQI